MVEGVAFSQFYLVSGDRYVDSLNPEYPEIVVGLCNGSSIGAMTFTTVRQVERASRWWTRACGRCETPAPWAIVCVWWWLPSSPRTCSSTGARVSSDSGTCVVDADAASNRLNRQWVAGSGADAAPYFRVSNPQLQASMFDPKQEYIRRYLPEWEPDASPQPIVDLAVTREAALAAYKIVKAKKSERSAS